MLPFTLHTPRYRLGMSSHCSSTTFESAIKISRFFLLTYRFKVSRRRRPALLTRRSNSFESISTTAICQPSMPPARWLRSWTGCVGNNRTRKRNQDAADVTSLMSAQNPLPFPLPGPTPPGSSQALAVKSLDKRAAKIKMSTT